MARVFGITIPAGLEIIYNKTLKMYDISVFCSVGKNHRFLSRSQKYNLKQFTKLYQTSYAWAFLSDIQKAAWYTAGDASGINGYALWTQDKIYRLMNFMAGNATPSIFHQYKVGHINIDGAAVSAILTEQHLIQLALPCTVRLNYKSILTSAGADPYAKLVFTFLRFSSGKNIIETAEIDLDLEAGWQAATTTITAVAGVLGYWSVSIQMNDVVGDLYFDNLEVEYNSTIQNSDPFCDNFPKNWLKDDVGAGVTAESIYCPDNQN